MTRPLYFSSLNALLRISASAASVSSTSCAVTVNGSFIAILLVERRQAGATPSGGGQVGSSRERESARFLHPPADCRHLASGRIMTRKGRREKPLFTRSLWWHGRDRAGRPPRRPRRGRGGSSADGRRAALPPRTGWRRGWERTSAARRRARR